MIHSAQNALITLNYCICQQADGLSSTQNEHKRLDRVGKKQVHFNK